MRNGIALYPPFLPTTPLPFLGTINVEVSDGKLAVTDALTGEVIAGVTHVSVKLQAGRTHDVTVTVGIDDKGVTLLAGKRYSAFIRSLKVERPQHKHWQYPVCWQLPGSRKQEAPCPS